MIIMGIEEIIFEIIIPCKTNPPTFFLWVGNISIYRIIMFNQNCLFDTPDFNKLGEFMSYESNPSPSASKVFNHKFLLP
jgi:hypothetical protein